MLKEPLISLIYELLWDKDLPKVRLLKPIIENLDYLCLRVILIRLPLGLANKDLLENGHNVRVIESLGGQSINSCTYIDLPGSVET